MVVVVITKQPLPSPDRDSSMSPSFYSKLSLATVAMQPLCHKCHLSSERIVPAVPSDLLRVDLDQIAKDAIGLERLVVHLGPLVGVPSHDGQAVVVGGHHGLVGGHLRQTGDLDEAAGHELAGVDPVVVYSDLPRLRAD